MIVDVDIRISNDEGKQIQRFVKHFDGRFDSYDNSIEDNDRNKEFEEFLAEYLTASGRTRRNQLVEVLPMQGDTSAYLLNTLGSQVRDQTAGRRNDLEYTIRIGEEQSISGKIPLHKLVKLSELSEQTNQEQFTDFIEKEDKEDISGNEALVLKRNPFQTEKSLDRVNAMFEKLIIKAVKSYEASFYHVIDLE